MPDSWSGVRFLRSSTPSSAITFSTMLSSAMAQAQLIVCHHKAMQELVEKLVRRPEQGKTGVLPYQLSQQLAPTWDKSPDLSSSLFNKLLSKHSDRVARYLRNLAIARGGDFRYVGCQLLKPQLGRCRHCARHQPFVAGMHQLTDRGGRIFRLDAEQIAPALLRACGIVQDRHHYAL